jgi:hypothetical protein
MQRRLMTPLLSFAMTSYAQRIRRNLSRPTPKNPRQDQSACAAERQAALVREAKNERTVVWYAPMNREIAARIHQRVRSDYPFLKVEILSGVRRACSTAYITEQRAGKHNFDVLNMRSSALYTLKKRPHGHALSTRPTARAPRRLHRQRRLPKRYLGIAVGLPLQRQAGCRAQGTKNHRRLLQPRWKGKLGMDKDADDWLARSWITTAMKKANRSRAASARNS